MAHDTVYGFCENKCKVEVSPKSDTDAVASTVNGFDSRIKALEGEVNGALSCTSVTTSGTITSTGLITGNGGFKGNLTGSATSLNTTITVSPSTTSVDINSDTGFPTQLVLLPYVKGVKYTGTVQANHQYANYGYLKIYTLSNGTWSLQSHNSGGTKTFSFTAVDMLVFVGCRGGGSYTGWVKLPKFS